MSSGPADRRATLDRDAAVYDGAASAMPDAALTVRVRCAVAATLIGVVLLLPASVMAAPFGFDDVAAKAKHLADKPFESPKVRVPEWLRKKPYRPWARHPLPRRQDHLARH